MLLILSGQPCVLNYAQKTDDCLPAYEMFPLIFPRLWDNCFAWHNANDKHG